MSTTFLRARATLAVSDVGRSIAFYRDAVGFELLTSMGDPPEFALLGIDRVGIGLVAVTEPAVVEFACCYFDVDGVEDLHERCVAAGAQVTVALTRQPWGNYDFVVADPDGHQIAFGEVPDRG